MFSVLQFLGSDHCELEPDFAYSNQNWPIKLPLG